MDGNVFLTYMNMTNVMYLKIVLDVNCDPTKIGRMFTMEISDEIVWFASGYGSDTYVFNKRTREVKTTNYLDGKIIFNFATH